MEKNNLVSYSLDFESFLIGKIEGIDRIILHCAVARGDFDDKSDVDILVITDNINKVINIENYEIFLISEDNLEKKLSKSLYLASAIKEIVPLMNQNLLKKFKNINIKININELVKEIERILRINKDIIDSAKEHKEKLLDGTAYSLVLRLRELYLLKCIMENRKPNKKEFLSLIDKDLYDAYVRIKGNEKEVNKVNIKSAEDIYNLIKKWLNELKEQKQQL